MTPLQVCARGVQGRGGCATKPCSVGTLEEFGFSYLPQACTAAASAVVDGVVGAERSEDQRYKAAASVAVTSQSSQVGSAYLKGGSWYKTR